MNIQKFDRAQKYAIAFLDLFIDSITLDQINALEKAISYFKENYHYLVLLSIPIVPEEVKQTALKKIFQQYDISDIVDRLIDVILKDHQLLLIADIIEQIVRSYYEKKGIVVFTVESTYRLDVQELENVKAFLQQTFPQKTIVIHQKINESLIAGLRMYSDTLLWEHSIKKQLNAIEKALVS